jgi:hypothetical protein
MTRTAHATAPGVDFPVDLDLESLEWTSTSHAPAEGEFPLIAELDDKRFEIYSDGTFAEVER